MYLCMHEVMTLSFKACAYKPTMALLSRIYKSRTVLLLEHRT